MEAGKIFEVGRNNYFKGPMLGACLKGPARNPLGWTGGRVGILFETYVLWELGVGQIIQDSLDMMRSLVFTLNVMEPLWGFEQI